MEFDVNKSFIVPDDVNQKHRLWAIRFNEPVSTKRLLDALSGIKEGGEVLKMKHVKDDDTGKTALSD